MKELTKQEADLLQFLSESRYETAAVLARKLKISERTVRYIINRLNSTVLSGIVTISSKSRCGFILRVDDREQYKAMMNSAFKTDIPFEYEIISCLIKNQNRYLSTENMASVLYTSKQNVFIKLERVSNILTRYNIALLKNRQSGFRIDCTESDLRRLLANNITYFYEIGNDEMAGISAILDECLLINKIELTDIGYKDIQNYIYVMIKRISSSNFIAKDSVSLNTIVNSHIYDLSRQICAVIGNDFSLTIPGDEVIYFSTQFSGKYHRMNTDNIISEEYVEFTKGILNRISDSFNIDLSNDFDLLISLSTHIYYLLQRMVTRNYNSNPLLQYIKENYSFAFAIANQVAAEIKSRYDCDITAEEVGYIALIIELSLEVQNQEVTKKTILLVTETGRTPGNLMKYKLISMFDRYIKEIHTCSIHQIQTFPVDLYDYVFTTVDMPEPLSVPVIKTSFGLDDAEVESIRMAIINNPIIDIDHYFPRQVFLNDLKGKTKEEVLMEMSRIIGKEYSISSNDLYESIWEREILANTYFDNSVAMPHASKIFLNKTVISAGILEKPVNWGNDNAQIIFLVLIGSKDDGYSKKLLYDVVAKFIFNSKYVNKLISNKEYEAFISQLKDIYSKTIKEDS